jgi:N-acetylglutamate synthase-like GNAT family acetyltransferase
MLIRPMKPADLDLLDEIDATVQSETYLHVDRSAEALSASFRIESRPLPERKSQSNPLGDDLRFQFKQVATGIDDGFCIVAEHGDLPIAAALAIENGDVTELIDLRIDFDRRREGLGSGLMFQVINFARERESRAVRAFVQTANGPFNQMLAKLGFEIAGIDTQRHSNHDLVKEQTTLIWYLQLI